MSCGTDAASHRLYLQCADHWACLEVLDDVYIEQENVLDKLQYFIEQREMEAAGQV